MENAKRKTIDDLMAKYPKLKELGTDRQKIVQFLNSNEEISAEFRRTLVHASNPEIALLDEIDSLSTDNIVMALLRCQQGIMHFREKQYLFYKKMARLFEELQNYKDAIIYMEKAIKTTPKTLPDYEESIFWLQMVVCDYYVKVNEIPKAFSCIKEISAPTLKLAYHRDITKAEILYKLELFQFALLVIDGAIRNIIPKDSKDYRNLYNLYCLKLKIDKKLNNTEKCVKDEEKIAEYSFLMLPL